MVEGLSGIQYVLLIALLIVNVYTLSLFYIDKNRAVNHSRNRISEKRLLLSSLFFGGLGAWLGMSTFRHKTKHTQFKVLVPVTAGITVFVVYMILNIN